MLQEGESLSASSGFMLPTPAATPLCSILYSLVNCLSSLMVTESIVLGLSRPDPPGPQSCQVSGIPVESVLLVGQNSRFDCVFGGPVLDTPAGVDPLASAAALGTSNGPPPSAGHHESLTYEIL